MVVKRTKLAQAKLLRHHPTRAEAEAWKLLRNRQILGLKFRRQKPLFGFIVDFYCAELRLVIEIDGKIHDTPEVQAADRDRTILLEGRGFTVIRIRNDQVTENELTRKIQETARALHSGPPSPVPGGPRRERGLGGEGPRNSRNSSCSALRSPFSRFGRPA